MNPINSIPIEIISYLCHLCGKPHSLKKGGLFWEHFDANAVHYD